MYNFGQLIDNEDIPYQYSNIYAIEHTSGPDRLTIAPKDNHVHLIKQLSSIWDGEYGILYILLVSRSGKENARYQSPYPLSIFELNDFLDEYAQYFETDGRHHVWVGSRTEAGNIVYDHHNVIFAYGDLAKYQEILSQSNFTQVPKVSFPVPHTHHYNKENDMIEHKIMDHWDWLKFPLQPADEY